MIVRTLALAALAAALVPAAATAAPRPLATGIFDPTAFSGARAAAELRRARAAGATVIRLRASWRDIAPSGATAPPQFDAANPDAPEYSWSSLDAQVQRVVAAGFEPVVDVVEAPQWARVGSVDPGYPDARALGVFARAAARRYSGDAGGLPRVRYWQVWNEPNLTTFISPQLQGGRPVSPGVYRAMVNAFAAGVKSVRGDNLVVAGGLAPFRDNTPSVLAQDDDWGPLSFMRELLCLSPQLRPTCAARVRFDVWATHPYTSGGPTHHATLPNDVSLGDLPEMTRALRAAERAGHIASRGSVRFWVTEFSWDSNPPDPKGVPVAYLRQWVPRALYEMWRNGVEVVVWFSVRDEPLSSFFQSGLYTVDGAAKPYLRGFRFPVVGLRRGGGVYVWGRIPPGSTGSVRVEGFIGGAWRSLGTLTAPAGGVFQRTFAARGATAVRARAGRGDTSLAFSLTPVPDAFFNPFGGTEVLEPAAKR